MSIRFVALQRELVKSRQAGGMEATDRNPSATCPPGGMMPCRHCPADINEGAPYLVLAHRPFPAAQS
jgi:hypothetical protein